MRRAITLLSSLALIAAASFFGNALAEDRPAGPPHGPPPEALAACQDLAEGDACTVKIHDHVVEGICRSGPDGKGALACAPKDPPPHPHHRR